MANRLRCPHCRGVLPPSRGQDWREQRMARGLCVRCGQKKAPEEEKSWLCRRCRLLANEQRRKRYAARRGRTIEKVVESEPV